MAGHDIRRIIDILVCPECRIGDLMLYDTRLSCNHCGVDHPIVEGIPVLLQSKANYDIDLYMKLNDEDMINYPGEKYITSGYDTRLFEEINPKQGELILDLGCGHGHVSNTIMENCDSNVIGFDFNLGVLQLAENPLSVCGSADNITFKDNVFDRIITIDMMEHVPPSIVDDVISEMYRVLKPNGILYIDYPGNKIPIHIGNRILNILIFFVRLFDRRLKYRRTYEGSVHPNTNSYPHQIRRQFEKHGFRGGVKIRTVKFMTIVEPYRTMAHIVNVFPFNYLFNSQIVGRFQKSQ